MADPYATSAPDLSARPTGPPDWEAVVSERGGALVGPGGDPPAGSPLVVACRGIGTLAPIARVRPELAVLLWLEHVAERRDATAANALLAELRARAAPILAIKQGMVGGPPERPGCAAVTAKLIRSVLDAEDAGSVLWETDPDFGYEVPSEVEGLGGDSWRVLLPRLLYADHDRVYEHASLVAAKKRERHALASAIPGLATEVVEASGWPPAAQERAWRS